MGEWMAVIGKEVKIHINYLIHKKGKGLFAKLNITKKKKEKKRHYFPNSHHSTQARSFLSLSLFLWERRARREEEN